MKIKQLIQRSPTATPIPGVAVRARRESDGATLALLTTDADGFVAYTVDGHPGRFYLQVSDQPGGEKYWSSYDTMAAGPLSPAEVPAALSALGDGVIRGFLNALAVSAGSGNSLTLGTGGAVVYGHPVINATADTVSFTRPTTSTRIDRVVVRLTLGGTADGKAEFGLLAGTEGGSAPALTQTTSLYEISLAQVSIPTVAPITITDERTYSGERLSVFGVAR